MNYLGTPIPTAVVPDEHLLLITELFKKSHVSNKTGTDMKKLLLFLTISVGTISPLKAELNNSTKAALAVGAGIATAVIYAWNRLKPATVEQILAQGETILAKGAQYESIISLLHDNIVYSRETFCKETLTAAEILNLQEILTLTRKLQAHSDILKAHKGKTDQSSELISRCLRKQLHQIGFLWSNLISLRNLALIAECEKTLAQQESFQPVISLLQSHSIHSPSDVSENALSDFYEHTYYPQKHIATSWTLGIST